jgi:general secretion pathway protein G
MREPIPTAPARRRRRGFTLIEIMAVVLIIGLLGSLVGVVVFDQVQKARVTATQTQLKQLEAALEFYQMDNGRYPTTEQGLDALVREPAIAPEPRNYPPGGYLREGRVPLDPWGSQYQYEMPGTHNAYGFDLWSHGADAGPGGEGNDADIGNWASES